MIQGLNIIIGVEYSKWGAVRNVESVKRKSWLVTHATLKIDGNEPF